VGGVVGVARREKQERKIFGAPKSSPPPEPTHVHPPHGSGSWRSRTPTSLDCTSCWGWHCCRCRCRCRARVTDGDTTLAAAPSSPTPGSRRRRRRRRRRRQTPGRVDLLPSSLLAHAGGIMMVRGNGLGHGLCAVVGAAAAAAPIDGRFRCSGSSNGSVVDVLRSRSPVSRCADRVGGGRRRTLACAWSPSLSSRRPSPVPRVRAAVDGVPGEGGGEGGVRTALRGRARTALRGRADDDAPGRAVREDGRVEGLRERGEKGGRGGGESEVGPETFQRVVKPLPASAAPVPAYLEDASVVPLKRVRGKRRRARR
jgi:hypothetical protein